MTILLFGSVFAKLIQGLVVPAQKMLLDAAKGVFFYMNKLLKAIIHSSVSIDVASGGFKFHKSKQFQNFFFLLKYFKNSTFSTKS